MLNPFVVYRDAGRQEAGEGDEGHDDDGDGDHGKLGGGRDEGTQLPQRLCRPEAQHDGDPAQQKLVELGLVPEHEVSHCSHLQMHLPGLIH
jgi:hypothetical protein